MSCSISCLGHSFTAIRTEENEAGADQAVADIADDLRGRGRKPYIIPLGPDNAPLGALGYIVAAAELAEQCASSGGFDEVIVGSGSALTHAGLLVGFSALGLALPVRGVSVRRHRQAQIERVRQRVDQLIALLGLPLKVPDRDIDVFDGTLAPGYGLMNDATRDAIHRTARSEGLFLDPVYTGKVMAGLIQLADGGTLSGKRILFWHTGGQPALFGYADQLTK